MPLIQITAPTVEPVALADVHTHSNIVDTAQDSIIPLMIGAARRFAEAYTGRSFITQQWRLVLDSFPGLQYGGSVPFAVPYSIPPNCILLDKGNVLSVDSITYTAMDGTTQTMSPSDYVVELSGNPGRISPAFGKVWPIPLPIIGAVRVTYTAGYGPTAADVPEGLRQWILIRTATAFENREEVAILQKGKIEILPYFDSLLDPYRVETA